MAHWSLQSTSVPGSTGHCGTVREKKKQTKKRPGDGKWRGLAARAATTGKVKGAVGTSEVNQTRRGTATTQHSPHNPQSAVHKTSMQDAGRHQTTTTAARRQGQSKLQTRTNNPQRRNHLAYLRYCYATCSGHGIVAVPGGMDVFSLLFSSIHHWYLWRGGSSY